MMLFKYLMFWTCILLALCQIYCEARAVNVSNTWTMPQEGLNVFYRFFRDRISWFEADAVCQFHHASLVTVDNSFQFDATRDLLRELDVNDIVWIGLIRPQSSERFMWSNSRPLIANTGYWAESLPIMEAPLCAVIDPIRDYRWHALRCGGPETASFLCEMTVPSWADACILKDIPNLTMQYMADTASVELIRSCQEEGTLRQTCKGKQDRERIIRELVCPRERMEAQRINDITSSHFKSLKIINSVHTDNNENNDIELVPISVANYDPSSELADSQPVTEKNTVQRLIEQFNVDELMQADQPVLGLSAYKIPDEIPKPVKKFAKKYTTNAEYQKKENIAKSNQKTTAIKPEALALEDMMLGDQPQGEPELVEHVFEDEVSNEIMEVLPHRKKILPQDLKTMPSILETTATPSQAETVKSTTIHSLLITSSSQPNYHLPKGDEISAHATPPVTHPIHPHETHVNPIVHEENAQHAHKTDSTTIIDNSHFIPPMLLVKSHYVPPNKHGHEHEHEHERHLAGIENENASTTSATLKNTQTELPKPITTATITTTTSTAARETVDNDISVSTSQSPVRTSPAIEKQTTQTTPPTTTPTSTDMTPITTNSNSNPMESVAENKNTEPMLDLNRTTTTTTPTSTTTMKTIKPVVVLSVTELPELRKSATNTINNKQTETTTTSTTIILNKNKEKSSEESSEEQEKYERLFASKTTPVSAKEFEANVAAAFAAASKVGQPEQHELLFAFETTKTATEATEVATTAKLPIEQTQQATTTITAPPSSTQTTFTTSVQPIVATTTRTVEIEAEVVKTDDIDDKIGLTTNANELESLSTIEPIITTTATTRDIIQKQPKVLTTTVTTNIENKTSNDDDKLGQDIAKTTRRYGSLWSDITTTTFKPNRKRLLTKPETGSYFKKILG